MLHDKLISDLKNLGICENDKILIHSSYKALGDSSILFETIIDSLKELVKNGTLMMPTLSYSYVDATNNHFDASETPSCVGSLGDYFRNTADVARSLSPTHSVAIWDSEGKAKQIAQAQLKDNSPCGENSPFVWLKNNDGKIVMLGCGLFCNTSMHGVEEVINPVYLFNGEVEYIITDQDGNNHKTSVKRHYFKDTVQRYDRVADILSFEDGEIKKGEVLGALCYVIDAKKMWEKAIEIMKNDPVFFVDILNSN